MITLDNKGSRGHAKNNGMPPLGPIIEGQNMCASGYLDRIVAESACSRLAKRVLSKAVTLSER